MCCLKESCFKGEKQLKVKDNNHRKAVSVSKLILIIVLGILCQFFVVRQAYAGGEQLYFDQWGNLRMTTYDMVP